MAAERAGVVSQMSSDLARALEHDGTTTARKIDVDDAERSRLAALGYVTGSDHTDGVGAGGDLPDPRERIAGLNRMNAAMARFAGGDEAGAIADLDALLADEPGNHSAVATLGSLRFRTGDFSGAAEAYGRAARLAPQHAHYSELEAVSLEHLGRYDEAVAACERALAADSGRRSSRDIRWRLLAQQGRNDVLTAEAGRAVADDPADGMARVYLEQGRHGGEPSVSLVAALEEALTDLPDDPAVTAALADAVYGMGDVDRADGLYRRVLARHPENLNAALIVGRRAVAEGKIEEVRGFIEAGARRNPESAAMQLLLARLQMAAGEFESAREALVRAYRLKPGWAETWLAAGELGILEGLTEQAAANLDRAAAAAGDDPDLWLRLADANRRLGREPQAREAERRSGRK